MEGSEWGATNAETVTLGLTLLHRLHSCLAGNKLDRRDAMKRREGAQENLRDNDRLSGARTALSASLWFRNSALCGQGCPRSEVFVIALMLLLPFFLCAQTADDYFHGGATNYVFGQKEKAKEEVTTGLQ